MLNEIADNIDWCIYFFFYLSFHQSLNSTECKTATNIICLSKPSIIYLNFMMIKKNRRAFNLPCLSSSIDVIKNKTIFSWFLFRARWCLFLYQLECGGISDTKSTRIVKFFIFNSIFFFFFAWYNLCPWSVNSTPKKLTWFIIMHVFPFGFLC